MKHWYIEVSISYHDHSEKEVYVGVENYTIILPSKSENAAKKRAKKEALASFNEEINDGYANIKVVITDCYETTEDARKE